MKVGATNVSKGAIYVKTVDDDSKSSGSVTTGDNETDSDDDSSFVIDFGGGDIDSEELDDFMAAAMTAAMNSASVPPVAIVGCILVLWKTASPARHRESPVMEQHSFKLVV